MKSPLQFDLAMGSYTQRDADGFYRVQVRLFGDKGSQPFESYHHTGFLGRPRDPDVDPNGLPKIGPTILYGYEGNQGHAIILSDPRVASRLPEVKRGGSMQYGDTGSSISYALFDGDTGDWTLNAGKTIHVSNSAVELGGGTMKSLANEDLIDWINTVLRPALASAPGGPINVAAPPDGALTMDTRAS